MTLPSSTGFTTYKDNIGEVMNKGFEIQLRSNVFQNEDWLVAVFANLAHNKNEILKISDSLKDYNNKVLAKYDDYDEAWNRTDEKVFGNLSAICGRWISDFYFWSSFFRY